MFNFWQHRKSLFSLLLLYLHFQTNAAQLAVGLDEQMNRLYIQNVSIPSFFSNSADVTVGFITCDNISKLKITVRSFIYYNTEAIRKIIIFDHCNTKVTN